MPAIRDRLRVVFELGLSEAALVFVLDRKCET
jgi:hypothetical protein